MSNAVLHLPRTLFGQGMLAALADELRALDLKRPLVVSDRGLVEAGILARVLKELASFEHVAVLDNVTENPMFSDAEVGAESFRRERCDAVVALGGGSVIDAAKYIALLARNDGRVADYIGPDSRPHKRCAPLIVIPTTAGTGSEASPDAGIHPDAQTASVGMRSRHIVPDVAILDPELTVTLPPRLTAATGIDAISHCIEGCLSKQSTALTDAILLDAIGRAVRNLNVAIADGANLQARSEMQFVAYAGGIGIGMGLGPAHAVAIACSDQGFNHGVLSGIGLVATLDHILAFAPDRAPGLRRAFGATQNALLSEVIAERMRSSGLPATLKELGYRATDLTALGEAAHRTPFNFTARHHFSPAAYASMIEASLTGATD
jgi:4-hydroxybutyrate dehydrogenase